MLASPTGWMLVTTILLRLPPSQNASPSTSPLPTPQVMMTLSKPRLQVVSGSAASASWMDAWVTVAPNSMAFSRLNSIGSMAAMTDAPAIFAPWMALLPMPPQPTTATMSPGCTSAAYTAEPQPVTTPQPSRQALSSGRSFSILMQLASCTTVWWANVPSAPMASVRSLPSLSW